ncbi:type II secretion system protein [Acetanaerobacterium elongatum]|uniref:Prepilin-type N-terminal cleavage/methylation domain-containing protein n=1 Tax=Acetanaerobacterium elongatum TaxID=258515 RepID=A0A1G9V5L7_9FIRM|nr:type II secretion system protein [Acetanaerobacterium elongatum]SDM67175.1 prepilin-type N-terminal cleavage/methylation domain-containing protein [Acetanaerobacterium elongatum]
MYLKNNKGLTLIELLITIAILGILMAAISAFIFPTMSFFAKNQNTSNAKNAANLMMDYIEGSVYSTDDITLGAKTANISAIPATIYGITADESKGITVFQGKGANSVALSEGLTEGLKFDISFSRTRAKVLCVDIKVQSRQSSEQLYSLKKDIYLANLLQAAPKDDIQNDGTSPPYREIRFTKPTGTTP